MLKDIIYRIKNNRLLVKGLVDTNYYFLAQLSSKVIGILVIPIVARLCSIEEFAYYDLFMLVSSFLSLVATLGIDSGIAIKIVENKDDQKMQASLLVTALFVNTAILLLLWAIGVGVSYADVISSSSYPLMFIHGLFIYTIIYQYNYNIFSFVRWVGKAKEAAWINFSTYFLGIVLGFVLLLIKKEIGYYIAGIIIGNLIGTLLSTYIVRDYLFRLRARLEPAHLKDLMVLSLPYLPTYLSNYAMQFVDRLLVTSAFGMEGLGLYAIVNRLAQIPVFFIQMVANGFQPVIFSNYENEKGQALARMIFNVFWIALIPATAAISFFSNDLLLLFGGEKYLAAEKLLPYIIVSTFMLGSFYLFGFGYSLKRKTLYVTFITLAVVGMIYLLSVYFIKLTGINGVAQATFIATTLGAMVYVWGSEKMYAFGFQLKWMFLAMLASTMILIFVSL
ncbi:oligosaccharide flippase family protein [Fulvivirgaceae bacterium PWU4]|uniref:Oligosaccharide flippase family protein n=1 Tax=Chryseosolibacter histidini TaxID=2782349 RepID=A0AAP2DUK1_9BACT|nr:oligosaccharide flippase family protein [Chryseosolibacter histidini]MBT1700919.1 oligosaccharide flippase family protein [Chryseosolibacter histidini]